METRPSLIPDMVDNGGYASKMTEIQCLKCHTVIRDGEAYLKTNKGLFHANWERRCDLVLQKREEQREWQRDKAKVWGD